MPDPVAPTADPQPNSGTPPAGAPPAAAPWFSDTQKPFVEAKGWKSPADAITSYENLEKLVGADKAGRTIVRPKDDKDAEGIAAFRTALGVPKDVSGYKLPETMKDDPTIKGLADFALKAGMPSTQFDQLVEWGTAMAKTQQDALNAEVSRVTGDDLAKLKAEWGPEFEKKAEYAKRFAQGSGWTPEEWAAIERSIGTKRMLEQFYKHGASTSEPNFVAGKDGGGMTPHKAEVQKAIDNLVLSRQNNTIQQNDYFAQMERLQAQLGAA